MKCSKCRKETKWYKWYVSEDRKIRCIRCKSIAPRTLKQYRCKHYFNNSGICVHCNIVFRYINKPKIEPKKQIEEIPEKDWSNSDNLLF